MEQYDHFIAVDWAQTNMAIARVCSGSQKMTCFEAPSSVRSLSLYLKQLRGRVILTLEESTASQWLYTELKDSVDRLVICCPHRNRLLSEGAKNDKIDAKKLVMLLKSGLLKEVFHTGDELIELRKLVSGYQDLVQSGIRLKNQRSAIYRAVGKTPDQKENTLTAPNDLFVMTGLEQRILIYEEQKRLYEKEFARLAKKHSPIRLLTSLPGISNILAVQIVARIVDAKRFPTAGHFLSYCGLIRLERMSGGRNYGSQKPRYCRIMKNAFKTAAVSSVGRDYHDNPINDFYLYLVNEKHYPEHIAKHAVSRRLATLAYGILKRQKRYNPERRERMVESI